MSKLSQDGLNAAVSSLNKGLGNINKTLHVRLVEVLARMAVSAYVDSVTAKGNSDLRGRRISERTIQMSKMLEGQTIKLPFTANQTIIHRGARAKVLMNNHRAGWNVRQGLNCTFVTRRKDGEGWTHDPTTNPSAAFVAAIAVGESKMAPTTVFANRQAFGSNDKIAARKILNNTEANWSCRATNQGLRITRVK